MTIAEQARRLSDATGYRVEADPYDVGYFKRVANEDRPKRGKEQQLGWDIADDQIYEEVL